MGKLVFLSVCLLAQMQQYFVYGQDITKCIYNAESCSCETNKGVIELNKATRNIPYNYSYSAQWMYSWQPCSDYTFNSVTAAMFQTQDLVRSKDLGVHRKANSDAVGGYARFKMESADGLRSSSVTCLCGSGDYFAYVSEVPDNHYNFHFTSTICCFESGISVGTIMVIVFFSILFLYFVVGTIIQVAVRKAQGVERIPNVSLWLTLPGLIKDGFIFTFTCGRRTGYTRM